MATNTSHLAQHHKLSYGVKTNVQKKRAGRKPLGDVSKTKNVIQTSCRKESDMSNAKNVASVGQAQIPVSGRKRKALADPVYSHKQGLKNKSDAVAFAADDEVPVNALTDSQKQGRQGELAKQGNALGDSMSLGRFTSESLNWEKWSVFGNHNRLVEEAKSFVQPGSVAKKKAFFEARYKKAKTLKDEIQ